MNKIRIPTLLGLSLLMLGIITGVYLTIRNQNFYIKASPDLIPQNPILTNIDGSQATISWQTSVETPIFIIFGQDLLNTQTALDDKDANTLKSRTIHHITLTNLLPKTTYQYKIIAGKYSSQVYKFTTASPASEQNGFSPVIGSVLNGNQPVSEATVYLAISGAVTQSTIVKQGNFVIPISLLKKADLSDTFPLTEEVIAKITIISNLGESSALFKLVSSSKPLPPLQLGQNLDFTNLDLKIKPASSSAQALNKYDLNNDRQINANDYAIILKNLGRSVKGAKGDLNGDRIIDQKDLELMLKQSVYE